MYIHINTQSGPVPVEVKRKNIKSMRLRVTSEAKVEVSAPMCVRESVIKRFVQDNAGFVASKLSAMEYKRACSYPESYKDGDVFGLLGQRTLLKITKGTKTGAKLLDGALVLIVPDASHKEACRQAFINFIRRYAKKVFTERLLALLPKFENLCGKSISISVRDMKTRWGSINVKNDTMSLSIHLLRCESKLIDHIIIHELCHYSHANHSKEFYEELKKHNPDYKKLQKRLKEYGMVGF